MSPGTTAMPSPFPGMDPFIEEHAWQGFHSRYITAMSDLLVSKLRPRYIVEVETYVFVETDDPIPVAPDVAIARAADDVTMAVEPAFETASQPLLLTLPATPRRQKQHFLSIRTRSARQVVTIIELLSPTNKRPGAGRSEYEWKRDNVIASGVNLVEIDLLRSGTRIRTREPLPDKEYFAFVVRSGRLPKIEVYAWALRDRLPDIRIPLASGDSDAVLELQQAFDVVYDRAGYNYALDYTQEVVPPLPSEDAASVRSQLAGMKEN